MSTNESNIIVKTVDFVKHTLEGAEGGHDWWHIERVWNNAKAINQIENANHFIVELAALLHDIADSKFHGGDEEIGPKKAIAFLESLQVDSNTIHEVAMIIRHISFKGGHITSPYHSPELAVVQDADRLDAIGAIGIARAFHYGGFKKRELYNPNIEPDLHLSKEAYKSSTAPTINHFYEKLLLLKDKMNTTTGKKMATERHDFMVNFLQQFYAEWNGNK